MVKGEVYLVLSSNTVGSNHGTKVISKKIIIGRFYKETKRCYHLINTDGSNVSKVSKDCIQTILPLDYSNAEEILKQLEDAYNAAE